MANVDRGPSGVLLVLLAIIANCWILALPFQGDDYLILPKVGEALRIDPETPSGDTRADTQIGNFYLFRPVPWFVWWLTIRLHGNFADPAVFHAIALLIHAATALLLRSVLRRIFAPTPAFLGAAFFAIAPGAVQATSFIAAAGDQYAVFFMLCAASFLQRHRRAPSTFSAGATGLCAALAFCSKDVAIASLPAVLLAGLAQPGSQVRSWRAPFVAIAIGLLLAITGRALYLGTWTPAYLTAVRLGISDLARLPSLFLEFLAPWRRFEEVAAMPPLLARLGQRVARGDPVMFVRAAALVAFLLPLAAGLLRSPLRVTFRLSLLGAALVAVLVPALTIFDPSYTQVISRVFYPAAAVCGAALAAGVTPWLEPSPRSRVVGLLVLPLLLACADFMVHVARTELFVGRLIDGRLQSLSDLVKSLPEDAHVVAIDEQYAVGGIPTLYFGVGPAMKPPMCRQEASVTWWSDVRTLPRGAVLVGEPRPVAIARIIEDRYVLREPIIPAIPRVLPALARDAGDSRTWRFAALVPARAVLGVRIESPASGVFPFTWIGSRGTREAKIAFPAAGGVAQAIAGAPEDFDWLADPQIVGLRFDGCEVAAVEPLAALPEVHIEAPEVRARLPASGSPATIPEVTFAPPPGTPSGAWRLTVEFAFSDRDRPMMISEEPAFVLKPRGGGRFGYDIARQATSVIVPSRTTDASTLIARLAEALAMSGSGLVPLALRIEGVDPRSGAVESRSPWRVCFLDRRWRQ